MLRPHDDVRRGRLHECTRANCQRGIAPNIVDVGHQRREVRRVNDPRLQRRQLQVGSLILLRNANRVTQSIHRLAQSDEVLCFDRCEVRRGTEWLVRDGPPDLGPAAKRNRRSKLPRRDSGDDASDLRTMSEILDATQRSQLDALPSRFTAVELLAVAKRDAVTSRTPLVRSQNDSQNAVIERIFAAISGITTLRETSTAREKRAGLRPVTPEVAGSSPVGSGNLQPRIISRRLGGFLVFGSLPCCAGACGRSLMR